MEQERTQDEIELVNFLFACFTSESFFINTKGSKDEISFVKRVGKEAVELSFHPANDERKTLVELMFVNLDINERTIHRFLLESAKLKEFIEYSYSYIEKENNREAINEISFEGFEEQKREVLKFLRNDPTSRFDEVSTESSVGQIFKNELSYDIKDKESGVFCALHTSGFFSGSHSALRFELNTAIKNDTDGKFHTHTLKFFIPILNVPEFERLPQERYTLDTKNLSDVWGKIKNDRSSNMIVFKSLLDSTIGLKEEKDKKRKVKVKV